ncbi:MAG: leucine-rich repeat protein [Eubacteriales bacterium]|nr:leucine-rich repeat protein [Eubacteriales bacterium]
MQTIEGENELLLTCRKTQDGVSILRCETRDGDVRLPDEIGGAPVTALGGYALSARAPALADRETFSVRVTCGGAAPAHDAAAVRRVTLPAQLQSVGSYAFFGCTRLETIELTGSVSSFGGGALMNCAALRAVRLRAAPAAPTCLQKLLGETAGEIDVLFSFGNTRARLLFPAYSEELEDLSPAHIFQRRIHGAGYGYRECFRDGVLQFAEYDRALSSLLERHDFAVAARAAVRRLAVPHALNEGARTAYLAVLRAHGGALARDLAARGESAGLSFLLSLSVLSAADLAAACDRARECGQTAALSVLLAASGGRAAAGRTKTFEL